MRIAMVSEHASPLAVLGGVDAGGQNVHVAALAPALARRGARGRRPHAPRRPGRCPSASRSRRGVESTTSTPGPPAPVPKDELLPHMDAFADELRRRVARRPARRRARALLDVRARRAAAAARRSAVPVVQTFHALGVVKRRYRATDTSPPERLEIERDDRSRAADRVVATCTDEVFELVRLGADARRLTVIPCGVDLEPLPARRPGRAARRAAPRLAAASAGWSSARASATSIEALAGAAGRELVVAGGPDRARARRRPRGAAAARRSREHAGVADRVELRGARRRASDLPALLRSADASCRVPWYEPFGIVPLEAMACGVPVVASAVGGHDRHGRRRRHRRPRPAARPRAPRRGAARAARGPAPRAASAAPACAGRGGCYDWDRVAARARSTSTRALRARGRRALAAAAGASRRRDRRREHLGAAAARRSTRSRPRSSASSAGAASSPTPARGRPAAGRRQRRQRRAGAAPDGRAGRAATETERAPLSAICLHADTSSLTAIANDYGAERGVRPPGARARARRATCSSRSPRRAAARTCWSRPSRPRAMRA